MGKPRLVDVVPVLLEHGLRPSEVARLVYNIPEQEWYNLGYKGQTKYIARVNAIYKYFLSQKKQEKIYRNTNTDFIENEFYRNGLFIEYSGGEREPFLQRSPEADGTLDVVERKKHVRGYERYIVEYEQLLYFFYSSVFKRYEDSALTLWNSIKMVHKAVFKSYWERYGNKARMVWNNQRKHLPELVAAYIYTVFFAGLWRFPAFSSNRYYLLERLKAFIRNEKVFQRYIGELLDLFARYFL